MISMIEIAVCDDVIGIRKCTAFVCTAGEEAGNRRGLLSLAGSTWQVDSVSRSLDPLPRLHLERVEGLDCRRLSLSRQPRTQLERKTRRRAEEERIFGFVAEGFFFHPLRGWAIECVCRGGDR